MWQYENRLQMWQERLTNNQNAYAQELAEMDRRQALYSGSREIVPMYGFTTETEQKQPASVVRNIVAELVEAQVDSSIPMPKVTAREKEDEGLAKTIEDHLKNEVDRLPFEVLNDMDERITPVQGGNFFLVEWDAKRHTHTTSGEISVRLLHPKQVIPQNGVNEIEDMDFIIVRIAMTKQHVKEKYGIDVSEEGEESPESRGGESYADDVVTVNVGYFRNKNGGIGRYTWVNDVELEYLEDYQARTVSHCTVCGNVVYGDVCTECGSTEIQAQNKDTFVLYENIKRSDGSEIPAYRKDTRFSAKQIRNMMHDPFSGIGNTKQTYGMERNEFPYYKPDCYPIVLRRNVSAWGKVLGESDTDKIQDQQNAIKKCDTRIQEKLDKGGSVLTKHIDSRMTFTDEQLKVVEVQNPAEVSCLRVYNLQVDTSGDLTIAEQNYQSARNILGITDSFQGRKDTTATSGTAKQIAVAQAAGRLESKRIMKNAMYADLYQVMFKFLLAYSDEPRTVRHDKLDGSTEYSVFNKYDFLVQDDAGAWYWKDDFLFSIDTASALASNREAMWQETRQNLQNGAFGNPQEPRALLLFWGMMAKLHYPMAEEIKAQIEEMQQDSTMQNMQNEQNGKNEENQQMAIPNSALQRG